MFRSCFIRKTSRAAGQGAHSGPIPDPDHAWKTLGLVNEWIRHSDAKAAVTLAFTGVLGTMVFNLTKDFDQPSMLFDMLVLLACFLLVLTAVLCGWTLTPRMTDKDAHPESINRLYFGSISHHFKGERTQYVEALNHLTANQAELIKDLADQIHANAGIATTKARAAKWAIRSALMTGATVAGVAIIFGISNS